MIINTQTLYEKGETPLLVFPLGLGYIASVLRNNKYEVQVLDCVAKGFSKQTRFTKKEYMVGLDFEETRVRIADFAPDVALVGCQFSLQYAVMLRIATMIKSMDKEILVIAGGNHVSAAPEIVLKSGAVDYVIVGEGELTLLETLNAIKKSSPLSGVRGLGYIRGNRVQINKQLNLVPNLDILPFPAWDLFPYETYVTSRYKHTLIKSRHRTAEIITSRGCPFGCSYCASHVVSGTKWRARSVENIIDEITYLKKHFKVEEFHFLDDNLIMDRERFQQLCREITKEKIRWTMPNGINVSQLDKDLLQLMKEAGCYALFLPIESINPTVVMKHVRKEVLPSQIKSIVSYAKKQDFYLVGFFLLGFFEESREDIENTIRFATHLGLDEAQFSIITPLPGSEYYRKYCKDKCDFRQFSSKHANLATKYLDRTEVEILRNKAYIHFEIQKFMKVPLSYIDLNQIRRLLRYLDYIVRNKVGI